MASPSPVALRRIHTSSRSKTILLENDAMRLQRTADTFTIKLEHERRKDILLTEQIRIMEEELKRRKVQYGNTGSPEERKFKLKIATLSHELELVASNISDAQTYNRNLREQIEGCRLEQSNYRAAIKTFTEKLEDLTHAQGSKVSEYLRASSSASRLKTAMSKLRSRSVNERAKQQARLHELTVGPI